MDYFRKMNKMLSEGYKMTDYECPKCKSNAIIDESLTNFYCCKCEEEILLKDDELLLETKQEITTTLQEELEY